MKNLFILSVVFIVLVITTKCNKDTSTTLKSDIKYFELNQTVSVGTNSNYAVKIPQADTITFYNTKSIVSIYTFYDMYYTANNSAYYGSFFNIHSKGEALLNDKLSADTVFTNINGSSVSIHSESQLVDFILPDGDHYYGFRTLKDDNSGDSLYAWIKINWQASSHTLKIIDGAVNTKGDAILIGQME